MRRILLAASLFLLAAPATQAAALGSADDADVDFEVVEEAGWFRMWCYDREFIYTTPGGAIGACLAYLPGRLAPIPFCMLSTPIKDLADCL